MTKYEEFKEDAQKMGALSIEGAKVYLLTAIATSLTQIVDVLEAKEKECKTGKWIVEKDCEGKTRTLICPFCKWKSGKYAWEDYNFCPNCGTEMEVGE